MPEDDDENEYEREEQMMENIQKTYLVTDSLTTQLPANFVFSTNKKYIEVQNCKLYDIDNDEWPEDVSMHMNLIHERDYLDNNVGYVNQIKTKYRRYEVKGNEEELKLWFVQERSGPTTVDDPFIYDTFPDKKLPKFEDIDYRNQPETKDMDYLYEFLKTFFTTDILDQYQKSKLTIDVDARLTRYKNNIIDSYYEDVLTPLLEDKSFYTNDYLLHKLYDILHWAIDLELRDHYTIAVDKFVKFFLSGFMDFLNYDFSKYDSKLYLPALGVCLAAPIYYEKYSIVDYLDELQGSGNPFITPTLELYYSFTMFNYYRIYNNTKFKYNIGVKDGTIFTEYWSVVEPLMKKLSLKDAHLMLQLAKACSTCDIGDNYQVEDCLAIIGKDWEDFEFLFSNGNCDQSRMYFFIELTHLYAGYKQEPLVWHEYSSSYYEPTNTTTAIEIAIDPLYPDWWIYREVIYNPATYFKPEHIYLDGREYKYRYRFFAEFMLIF